MTVSNPVAGPCAGLKVVELGTSMVSGPFCGQMLADLGAEVIKIEGPYGDMMRSVPPFRNNMSGSFLQFNRNKKSIVIDLKAAEADSIVFEMLKDTDVLIENFRPGVADRLGFGYEAVRERNPELIYVSISGFGEDGPYAKLPAYDMMIQGLVGFMPIQGSTEDPHCLRNIIVDKLTSMSATTAVLAALLHRERGNAGQRIEIKMLDAWAAFILPDMISPDSYVDDAPGHLPSNGVYRALKTSDGHLIGLIAQDSQFKAMCEALGCEYLLEDERFTTPAKRFAVMDDIFEQMETVSTTKTTKQWLEIMWKDTKIAIAPVNTVQQFYEDPQVLHNGTIRIVDDEKLGKVRQLGPFASFEKTKIDIESSPLAPQFGEHTDQVLKEMNFDLQQIKKWRESKLIQ